MKPEENPYESPHLLPSNEGQSYTRRRFLQMSSTAIVVAGTTWETWNLISKKMERRKQEKERDALLSDIDALRQYSREHDFEDENGNAQRPRLLRFES
ncbi:MAG: twin-arginine translocation signal domain-containing protein [Patescibacteria group bacterium]